jgi:hypothetical protein
MHQKCARNSTHQEYSDELLPSLLELAWSLTPLGSEPEAVAAGQRAIELARSRQLEALEIEALLHTATALQYTGDATSAGKLFEEAIARVHATGLTEHLHYLLHHR